MKRSVTMVDPLMEFAPFGFVSFADDGIVHHANVTLHEYLGLAPGSLVGAHIESILTVGGRIFYHTHLFPVLRMHGVAEEIFLLLRAVDGSEIGAIVNAVRRERDGRWVNDCAFMRVVERRKFEDALLRAKKDAESARAEAERIAAELQRSNMQLEEQAVELEMIQQQLEEQSAELEIQSEHLLVLNNDLTTQAQELERQRNLAEMANQAKSAFLASMSHELRTPLNAIGGYAQLLEMGIHGPVTPEQREALQKVLRSQRHLLRLINEVLNLSRIEAGNVEYEVRDVRLREIVDAVMPMVEPQMTERAITCTITIDDEPAASADRQKAEQILLNLLGNAVKFTPRGGAIRIHATADDAGALIDVSDTGVGIPADKLSTIFDPFVQVHTSPAGRTEGTGLGLAISRDLARGMKGDLSATSELGKGTCMTLVLPPGVGTP